PVSLRRYLELIGCLRPHTKHDDCVGGGVGEIVRRGLRWLVTRPVRHAHRVTGRRDENDSSGGDILRSNSACRRESDRNRLQWWLRGTFACACNDQERGD